MKTIPLFRELYDSLKITEISTKSLLVFYIISKLNIPTLFTASKYYTTMLKTTSKIILTLSHLAAMLKISFNSSFLSYWVASTRIKLHMFSPS
jgi:hypothetical protein